MKADEFIDDVAKAMTAVDTRPALRARVRATIGEARQEPARGWFLPAAASATVAALALAWFMLPSRQTTNETPMARQAPAIASVRTVVEPTPPIEVATAAPVPAPVRASTRRAVTLAAVTVSTWLDEAPADTPTLPPLAGPQPIVIEPITWDEVRIAPLIVELIEVKALAVEPLAVSDRSGV
jgi:hypothetical protein